MPFAAGRWTFASQASTSKSALSPARHRSIRAALGRPTPGTGSGRTVTLKVKYTDFQQITRSRTGQALLSTRAEIEQLSYALLEPLFPVTECDHGLCSALHGSVARHLQVLDHLDRAVG